MRWYVALGQVQVGAAHAARADLDANLAWCRVRIGALDRNERALVDRPWALDGPGSEGLGLRQRYSVTLVRGHHRTSVANGLIAVPSNVGPRTMPDYASLAAQGTYDLGNGIKVFAGQREDPFYIDLGAVFDINIKGLFAKRNEVAQFFGRLCLKLNDVDPIC